MKCVKCGYVLTEDDYYCPRCGELAIDLKENLKIIVPLRWCRTIGVICLISAIVIYGLGLYIMKKIHISYFACSIFLSVISIVYIARSYDSLSLMKRKNRKNKKKSGYEYCKHCYNKMKLADVYCSMCGYKRK